MDIVISSTIAIMLLRYIVMSGPSRNAFNYKNVSFGRDKKTNAGQIKSDKDTQEAQNMIIISASILLVLFLASLFYAGFRVMVSEFNRVEESLKKLDSELSSTFWLSRGGTPPETLDNLWIETDEPLEE